MPVEDFIAHAGFVLKDPLGLLDRFARQSAIPIGKRAEGVKFGHRAEIIYDANGNKVYEKWWYDPELSEVSYGQEYYIYSDASLELDLIPNGTPVEKADVEAYRARIVKMLENPICKKFIQELLEEARTQTGKSYADILTTFDTIKFFWGDTNPHGGLAHFVADPANPANGIPAATISDTIIKEKPSGSLANQKDRKEYLIGQTTQSFLDETLHHVGEKFSYDDAVMANALNTIRVRKKIESPRTFSSLTNNEANNASIYWHPKLWTACPAPRN